MAEIGEAIVGIDKASVLVNSGPPPGGVVFGRKNQLFEPSCKCEGD